MHIYNREKIKKEIYSWKKCTRGRKYTLFYIIYLIRTSKSTTTTTTTTTAKKGNFFLFLSEPKRGNLTHKASVDFATGIRNSFMKKMSVPKNLQDCYFFYYSACRKVSVFCQEKKNSKGANCFFYICQIWCPFQVFFFATKSRKMFY